MAKKTDNTDVANLAADVALLKSRALALRNSGNVELAIVYDLALAEFQTGAALSQVNTVGVSHSDVRK